MSREMRKIYKKIAKKYGISVDEVKRDMQEAINYAYVNKSEQIAKIPKKGEIPNVEEFINYVAKKVKP